MMSLTAMVGTVLAALAALLAVFFKGRSGAKKEAEATAEAVKTKSDLAGANDTLAAVKDRNEADTTVAALPADDVSKQLQDDWTRYP